MSVITLLSDFGLRDPYVAEIKAVILSIYRDATIIDISHEVKKYDLRMGAFILAQATPYFPKGTIHMAVVDPGVGTSRRPIIIEAKNSLFIGPDNGLLILSAQKEGILHIYKIVNPKYMLKNISKTFHGRDIFSSAAAYLAKGVHTYDFGPEITDPIIPSFIKPVIYDGKVQGEVLYIDSFGNIISNIKMSDLIKIGIEENKKIRLKFKGKSKNLRLWSAYGEVRPKNALAIIGSSGFLEVAVNQGNASQIFNVESGDKLITESG